MINDCLDDLIRSAKDTRVEEDAEALQNRDYSKVSGLLGCGWFACTGALCLCA